MSVSQVESLYEDEGFSHRELAALLASKVRFGWETYPPPSPSLD